MKEEELFKKVKEMERKRDKKGIEGLVKAIGKDKAGGVLDAIRDFFGKEKKITKKDWL